MYRFSALFLLLSLATVCCKRVDAQQADSSYNVLIHHLVVDRFGGYRYRDGMMYFTPDSATANLLRLAQLPVGVYTANHADVACPGAAMTDTVPVGLRIAVSATEIDSVNRRVKIDLGCNRNGRGFREWATWDLRRDANGWTVVREFDHLIT